MRLFLIRPLSHKANPQPMFRDVRKSPTSTSDWPNKCHPRPIDSNHINHSDRWSQIFPSLRQTPSILDTKAHHFRLNYFLDGYLVVDEIRWFSLPSILFAETKCLITTFALIGYYNILLLNFNVIGNNFWK